MTGTSKLFVDLRKSDFEKKPVWLWPKEGDTVRPWRGRLPLDTYDRTHLVKGLFRTASKVKLTGFIRPDTIFAEGEPPTLTTQKPHILFDDGPPVGFITWRKPTRKALDRALAQFGGMTPEEIFPMGFDVVEPGLTNGFTRGWIQGFHYMSRGKEYIIV